MTPGFLIKKDAGDPGELDGTFLPRGIPPMMV